MIFWKSLTILFIILLWTIFVASVEEKGKEIDKTGNTDDKSKAKAKNKEEGQHGKKRKLEIGGSSNAVDKRKVAKISEEGKAVAELEGGGDNAGELLLNEIGSLKSKNNEIMESYGHIDGTFSAHEIRGLATLEKLLKLFLDGIANQKTLLDWTTKFKVRNEKIIRRIKNIEEQKTFEQAKVSYRCPDCGNKKELTVNITAKQKMPKGTEQAMEMRNEADSVFEGIQKLVNENENGGERTPKNNEE